jgi:hypothetical protein
MENINVLSSPYEIYDIFGLERPSEDITVKVREQKKKKARKEAQS